MGSQGPAYSHPFSFLLARTPTLNGVPWQLQKMEPVNVILFFSASYVISKGPLLGVVLRPYVGNEMKEKCVGEALRKDYRP